MEKDEFINILIEMAHKIGENISENEANKFYSYMNLLLEWNKNINLTAITEEKEIIIKHFIDSLTINKYIKEAKNAMDIGTGAGFPGIPLKIVNEEKKFVLVNSLNKRISFLEEVKRQLELEELELIHSRVEDLAKNNSYREKMNVVTSRAVANLRVLVEYMLPFVTKGGVCICMKGPKIEDELIESRNAIEILGGEIEKIDNVVLPSDNEKIERNILIIRKVKETPGKYPRKAGIPSKQPL